jgi:putative transposase
MKDEVEKYICGIFNHKKQKVLAIYANADHIHEKKFLMCQFSWQEGYGAFSYSKSQKENVINYILNQKEHHQKQSFKNEYIGFLKKFEIDFKNEYIFDFLDGEKDSVPTERK